MLVLRRRLDEKIIITTSDGPIVVTVTKFENNDRAVKLGIEAPAACTILREELNHGTHHQ